MRFIWGALLVVAVFVGVGVVVDRAVLQRELRTGAPEAQVRLAAGMAGLFAGGASGTITVLLLAFRTSR